MSVFSSIIGKCGALHESALPIETATVTWDYIKTQTYIGGDPEWAGITSRTESASGVKVYTRVHEVWKYNIEVFDPEEGEFLLWQGCCCPCRWYLYTYLGGTLFSLAVDVEEITSDGDDPPVLTTTNTSYERELLMQFSPAGASAANTMPCKLSESENEPDEYSPLLYFGLIASVPGDATVTVDNGGGPEEVETPEGGWPAPGSSVGIPVRMRPCDAEQLYTLSIESSSSDANFSYSSSQTISVALGP